MRPETNRSTEVPSALAEHYNQLREIARKMSYGVPKDQATGDQIIELPVRTGPYAMERIVRNGHQRALQFHYPPDARIQLGNLYTRIDMILKGLQLELHFYHEPEDPAPLHRYHLNLNEEPHDEDHWAINQRRHSDWALREILSRIEHQFRILENLDRTAHLEAEVPSLFQRISAWFKNVLEDDLF